MPRDGLQQYAPPPGTNGITNYTIESTKYNGFVADVTQDLNLPRPIVAGGTGANNAHDAMIALSGEIAKQVVTNYDSFAWVNGSFYSAAGATSAPNPTNRFAGIYYANADDSYATVEARDQTTGIRYVRNKVAGVWGAWAQGAGSAADLDAAYVNVAGDTMTGPLLLPTPAVADNSTKAATTAFVNQDHMLPAATDLNTVTAPGTYACADASCTNGPTVGGQWYLQVQTYNGNAAFCVQRAIDLVTGKLVYTRANFNGVWTTWSQLASTGMAVRYDVAQALSAAQQTQARQNIYAAPFDAMGYNGIQINGTFEVNQPYNQVSTWVPLTSSGGGKYFCDGWAAAFGNPTANMQVATDRQLGFPNLGTATSINCGTLAAFTKMASIAPADYAYMYQQIEGYRFKRINAGTPQAQPVTIAFWAQATASGTATAVLRTGTSPQRGYPLNFALVAGVPKYVVLTFPPDTAGTGYTYGNAAGAMILFCFACGANYQAANGVWTNANVIGTPQTSNFFTIDNASVSIGNVVVLPGIEAPSEAQSGNIMRPFDQELLTCKRYYEIIGPQNHIFSGSVTTGVAYYKGTAFVATKRATPTMTGVNAAASGFAAAAGTFTVDTTLTGFNEQRISNATTAAGSFQTTVTADARL